MPTFDEALGAFSGTPVYICELVLDYCGRRFEVSPCTATGTPCFNTFKTCKDPTNYQRVMRPLRFQSADAPVHGGFTRRRADYGTFRWGAMPYGTDDLVAPRSYIGDIDFCPTEIKGSFTTNAMIKIEMADEADQDVGLDPYRKARTQVYRSSFWGKFIARNPNYRGRYARLTEGFIGIDEAEFREVFVGNIENIIVKEGKATIEIADILKGLQDTEIPPKLNAKLAADITAVVDQFTLTDATDVDLEDGYVRIGDEIIGYSAFDATTKIATGCTRGAFETTAATHSEGDTVRKVIYFPATNGFDILLSLLETYGSIPKYHVQEDDFTGLKAWPGEEIDLEAIIVEPIKLNKVYFELVNTLDCKSWVGEDFKIRIKKNLPNEPGLGYTEIADSDIADGSLEVDQNDKARITRQPIYWDLSATGDIDTESDFGQVTIAADADAESEKAEGKILEEKIYCRWVRRGTQSEDALSNFVKDLAGRRVFMRRDGVPLISIDLPNRHRGIMTGDYVRLSTTGIVNPDGSPLDRAWCQVVKREPKGSKISFKLERLQDRKAAWIASADCELTDWDSATEEQRDYNFIPNDDGTMPDGSPGYFIF